MEIADEVIFTFKSNGGQVDIGRYSGLQSLHKAPLLGHTHLDILLEHVASDFRYQHSQRQIHKCDWWNASSPLPPSPCPRSFLSPPTLPLLLLYLREVGSLQLAFFSWLSSVSFLQAVACKDCLSLPRFHSLVVSAPSPSGQYQHIKDNPRLHSCMPPARDLEAPSSMPVPASHGGPADVIDLTLSDDSDSDTITRNDDASFMALDVDEKPPTPNTSGTSHAGDDITGPHCPTNISQGSDDSDDNDLGALLQSLGKRKRKRKRKPEQEEDVAPEKPKPSIPSTFSLERCRAFFGNQLKAGASLFGIHQSAAVHSARMEFQGPDAFQDASQDQSNQAEDEVGEDEELVKNPYELHHVRKKVLRKEHKRRHESNCQSKTSRRQPRPNHLEVAGQIPAAQRASGEAETSEVVKTTKRSGAANDIQPAVRRASSVGFPALKKQRPDLSTLVAPKKNIAPVVFPLPLASPPVVNQAPHIGSIPSRPSSTQANTPRDGSKQCLSGAKSVNSGTPSGQDNAAVPSNKPSTPTVLETTVRRTYADDVSLVSVRSRESRPAFDDDVAAYAITTADRTRTATAFRPSTTESSQGDQRPPEALDSYLLQGSFVSERTREQRSAYAQPEKTKWENIARLGRPSAAEKVKRAQRLSNLATHVLKQPRPRYETSEARRRNNNPACLGAQLQRPQKQAKKCSKRAPQRINGVSTFQRSLSPTRGQSQRENGPALPSTNAATGFRRALPTTIGDPSQYEFQSESHQSMVTNRQIPQQLSQNQLAIRAQSPQPSQAEQTISLPNRAQPRQPYASRNEFAEAEAQMKALQEQYKKKSTTIFVDSLPADLGMPKPNHLSRRRAVRNVSMRQRDETERNEALIRKQRSRIKSAVLKEYARKPEEFQAQVIQERLDVYLERKKKRERDTRERLKKNLLTVDFLEDNEAGGFNGEEVDLDSRRIPAPQALGPDQTMVIYPVYFTEPMIRGANYENFLRRTKAFGILDSANLYAKRLLEGSSSPSSARATSKGKRAVAQCYRYVNGQLCGFIELGDGRVIYVQVEKEQQAVGNLHPSVLLNKYVDEEVLELYRPRYDVWLITVTPRAWLDIEKSEIKARLKRDRQQEREKKRETKRDAKRQGKRSQQADSAHEKPVAEDDEAQGLEGAGLRAALKAISAPGSGSGPQIGADDDGEDLVEDTDDDETSSQATADSNHSSTSSSAETVRCSSTPFGPLHSRFPNHYHDEVYKTHLLGSYTERRLANEQALVLAESWWKPRGAQIDAWLAYEAQVKHMKQQKDQADLDSELLDMSFDVPKYYGRTDHRQFHFVMSRLVVSETKLQGPRDIGVDFAMDMDEGPYRSTVWETAIENTRLAGDPDGEGEAVVRGDHGDHECGDSDDEDSPSDSEVSEED